MGFLERKRLRGMVSSATVALRPVPRLASEPADALVDLVVDGREPWWRRRACVQALAGRVPARRGAELVAVVRDAKVTTEVRVAVLAVVAVPGTEYAAELLAWLRAQDGAKVEYGLDVAVLQARGSLGDVGAARGLTELAADPWTHRRAVGEKALDELVAARGLEAVLAALGADSPEALALFAARAEDRLFGVRLLHRAGEDIAPALADAAVMVARAARDLLVAGSGGEDALREMGLSLGPGHLWALAVLCGRGVDVRAEWAAIGSPRVELPGVPEDVRAAILRAYAPGERGTDPRWLLEAACAERVTVDEEAQLRRVAEVLRAAGIASEPPVAAGDFHQQGEGTYHFVETGAGTVQVSTLGPYVAGEDDAARALAVLGAAGFRVVGPELGGIVFAGLHVYFFGRRDALAVGDLLFYWQD